MDSDASALAGDRRPDRFLEQRHLGEGDQRADAEGGDDQPERGVDQADMADAGRMDAIQNAAPYNTLIKVGNIAFNLCDSSFNS